MGVARALLALLVLLNEAILGLEWRRVGLLLVVILAVVAASEARSAFARRRLT
jgi:ABC-type phosphate/phosphonate transport system permease subunit